MMTDMRYCQKCLEAILKTLMLNFNILLTLIPPVNDNADGGAIALPGLCPSELNMS